jgi:outer membrane biosynthesis protein TonB
MDRGMGRASLISGGLHAGLMVAIVLGLPAFAAKVEPEPPSYIVEFEKVEDKAAAPNKTPSTRPDPKATEPKPPPPPAPPPKAAEPPPPPPKPPEPIKAEPKPPEPVKQPDAVALAPKEPEKPKVEQPKPPEPPKEEVKKPTPPTPPKPPETKRDKADDVLDALLQNKSENKPALQQQKPQPPQPQQQAARPVQGADRFASQISASEKDAVASKVRECWSFPAGAKDAQSLIVQLRVSMNPDGTVREARVVDEARYRSDGYFRAAADAAWRAVANPRCQPFPLPPAKYDTWRNFVFNFDPSDMI